MSIFYYLSIFMILIALVSFVYDLVNSQPSFIYGTLADKGEDGMLLLPDEVHEKGFKVHMAEGLRSELHPFTKDVKGHFLLMNNFVLVANLGIITVKSRHDLSINSPYTASRSAYWVGMLGPMILWAVYHIGNGPNAFIEKSFLLPLIIFSFACAGVWVLLHRLKAKIIVMRLAKYVNIFEQMRIEAIRSNPQLNKK